MKQKLTHIDENGNAVMVDVSEKAITNRTAVVRGSIKVSDEVMQIIKSGSCKKGDVLTVAQVAGIAACKRTSDLIPMCHPLMLTKCSVEFTLDDKNNLVNVECTVKNSGQTGVEMEALTGATVALLTIYDMCKAVDRSMEIMNVYLYEKDGGKSGHFVNEK